MKEIAFQDKLKKLREGRNLSMDELVNELHKKYSMTINKSTISRWEKGAEPKGKDLHILAHFFNVSPSELIDISFPDKPSNIIEMSPAIVEIPVLGPIACGDPILAEENYKSFRYESPDNLPSGTLFYLEAKGNSMEPTIPNGSFVLIREQPAVEYGEIAAVLVNGDTEATLKRVKHQGNTVILMPDNPDYEPYIITPDNPARVIGKAVRYTQDL